MIASGAKLVDIREDKEVAQVRIPGAEQVALSRIEAGARVDANAGDKVIFQCLSGLRTVKNADKLADATGGEGYALDGGLNAWRAAGLPVEE